MCKFSLYILWTIWFYFPILFHFLCVFFLNHHLENTAEQARTLWWLRSQRRGRLRVTVCWTLPCLRPCGSSTLCLRDWLMLQTCRVVSIYFPQCPCFKYHTSLTSLGHAHVLLKHLCPISYWVHEPKKKCNHEGCWTSPNWPASFCWIKLISDKEKLL